MFDPLRADRDSWQKEKCCCQTYAAGFFFSFQMLPTFLGSPSVTSDKVRSRFDTKIQIYFCFLSSLSHPRDKSIPSLSLSLAVSLYHIQTVTPGACALPDGRRRTRGDCMVLLPPASRRTSFVLAQHLAYFNSQIC